MKSRALRARGGYTLIEVATSVVIVAALTAAVLPVVVKQIDDAEPTRVANDLNSIAKGIELFHMNVRPTYPSNLFQLTTEITTSTTASGEQLEGNAFETKHTLAWKGPYFTSSVQDQNTALKTAFGGSIAPLLRLFDSSATLSDDITEGTNPTVAGSPNTDADFIALRIDELTEDDFNKIDVVIDGAQNSSTGRLRFVINASGTPIAYYLAVPISR